MCEVEDVVKDNFLAEVNAEGNVFVEVEDDNFVDTQRESLSVGSCGNFSDFGKQVDNQSLISTRAEFFDVYEGSARRLRRRKNNQQRWLWSGVGLA